MSIFRRPDYKSDATLFIEELKQNNQELDAQQRAGRALLWDKVIDRDAWQGFGEARVPQQAYVYQTRGE